METKVLSAETVGQDHVAGIVEQWTVERPDLDATPLLVVGRIRWLAERFDQVLRPPFAAAGLTNGDFDVLAALRRAGKPYVLRHRDLSSGTLVTPGAVTKRVDRLAGQGLVERRADPDDGRGQLIGLTSRGVRLVDQLIAVHLRNEAQLLEGLTGRQQQQLAALLGRLTTWLGTADGVHAGDLRRGSPPAHE